MDALQLSRIIIAVITLLIVVAAVCWFTWGRPKETWDGKSFKYAKWTNYGCMAAMVGVLLATLYLFKTTGDIAETRLAAA